MTSVSFHPGLKQIASASNDGFVIVNPLKSNNKVYKFAGHKGPVNYVKFAPSG